MGYEDLLHLHEDHRYARRSLELLHTSVSSLPCPPAGHAFMGLLAEASAYFERELPAHIVEEETHVFPHYACLEGAGALHELRKEHDELRELAAEFARWVRLFLATPSDEHWRMVREHANEIEMVMCRHMANEDAILRRLARAESAEGPGEKSA